jgi:hypothetical protein
MYILGFKAIIKLEENKKKTLMAHKVAIILDVGISIGL